MSSTLISSGGSKQIVTGSVMSSGIELPEEKWYTHEMTLLNSWGVTVMHQGLAVGRPASTPPSVFSW